MSTTGTTAAEDLVDAASITDGRAVVSFTRTESALADLRRRFEGVQFEITTTKGDASARAARKELVTLRTTLDRRRKELKHPAIEFNRKIDSEAQRLTAEIEALERPIDQAIKQEEQRREEERQAKLAAEQKRCDDHRARIADISAVATRAVGLPSAEIQAKIDLVTRIEIDATFEEFEAAAGNVKHETLLTLKDLHARALAAEDEAARVAADRARLQQLERENAERMAAQQAEQRKKDEEDKRLRAAEQAAAASRQIQSNLARELIEEIRVIQSRAFTSSAAGMLELVGLIEGIKIGSELGDFEGSAQKAREDALATLHVAHGAALEREAEKRRLEHAAADLERQQREWLAAHPPAPPVAVVGIDGGGADDQFAAAPSVAFDTSQPIEFMEMAVPADVREARINDTPGEAVIESLPQAMEILGVDFGYELPRHVAAVSKYDISDTAPMLSTGDIGRRLGLDTALPVATIEGVLGVPRAGQEKRAVLWRASQWPAIVNALLAHVKEAL